MDICLFFITAAVVLALLFFLPGAFKRCPCCGSIKPRFLFGYMNSKSGCFAKQLCKKCRIRYGINSLEEFRRMDIIRRKVEAEFYEDQKKKLHNCK
jgi:hypothetical protein